MLKEFQEFAMKGNVLDMAVGIIIGAAFTTIVKSLVDGILMPIVGYFTGGVDFTEIFTVLGEGEYASLAAAEEAGAAVIKWGVFINAVIAFLIVAWILFILIRSMNRARDQLLSKEEPAPEAAPAGPTQEELLLDIRDLLAKKV
ncbi:large conductance mechanosensitive channel protein MscL [Pikeienuella piscinae]|uniref:Large-conductance mechanosensitive channel n=1 Tax=Pikeienuella piscinae TaxID=2748098 RepID=A0A7L5C1K2_9RHOB|nr:large conductance mechanosensitive channel protein MscL [Pikeienuella piscinae]QIE55729.1 large conductance mechanosensitive channel protein MscL [Pikeienuella piscinae]